MKYVRPDSSGRIFFWEGGSVFEMGAGTRERCAAYGLPESDSPGAPDWYFLKRRMPMEVSFMGR